MEMLGRDEIEKIAVALDVPVRELLSCCFKSSPLDSVKEREGLMSLRRR